MTENTPKTLDFNSLLADVKSNGASTTDAAQRIKNTQHRILNELEFNKQFYMDYAHMIAPIDTFDEADLHDLIQDTVLRAIHNADAIPEEESIQLYLMSEMLACLDERKPGLHIDPNVDTESLIDENASSMEKNAHIVRVRSALKGAEKRLEPHERILMHAMLENSLSPDNIPQALLKRLDMEREDVLEVFYELFSKLREDKVLRNLHNDRDPDAPHSP